jgi:hypothetical protein
VRQPPIEAEAFAKWLRDEGACGESRRWSKGLDLLTIWNTCERGDWLEWLLNACGYQWTAPAYEAYQKAKAPAYEAYQKAKAPTYEAYQKAMATAEEAYQKATATSIRKIVPYPFEKEGK